MKGTVKKLGFILLFFLGGILPQNLWAQEESLNTNLVAFGQLLGEFQMQLFVPNEDESWQEVGNGVAHYESILGGSFLRKTAVNDFGGTTLTMETTIGFDQKSNQPKLIALDKEYGSIDIYEGNIKADSIEFINLNSGVSFTTKDGKSLYFRLTFYEITETSHKFLVEFSSDEGNTWSPYVKQYCKKVNP